MKQLINAIKVIVMVALSFAIIFGYIWFTFDMNMFAWGTIIQNIMYSGTIPMFIIGVWLGLLSYIFIFILVLLIVSFIWVVIDNL